MLILLSGLLAGGNAPAQAQQADEVFARIERAILAGDAGTLASFFGSQVEVTITDREDIYSKDQATFVVKEFFQNYPVRSFKILHKGSSSNTYYAVGEYYSTRGKFDTNVFIKRSGNTYVIEQIRFELEN
ncbi:MAG: DUF4783 domain-containing protein [Bacteroidetes bacterium]|nr:DUF4783 domain-containing protein [Bacteroidota bacterium]